MAIGDEIKYFDTNANQIFYGTGEDIAAYIVFINLKDQDKQHYKRIILDNGKVKPDGLKNNRFFDALYKRAFGQEFTYKGRTIAGKNKGYAINQYNEFMGSYATNNNTQIYTVNKATVVRNDKQYNQNIQGKPKARAFGDQVIRNIPAISVNDPSLEKAGMAGITAMVNNLAIRRSCKYGLEYFTARQGVVHYCLDRINNVTAADGKAIVLDNGANKYTICNSELRFLFRNWAQFRRKVFTTANAQGFTRYAQIRFYRGFKEVMALWEDPLTATAWISYAKHLTGKTIAVLEKLLQAGMKELPNTHILIEPRIKYLQRAIINRNDRSAITFFHNLIDYHLIEHLKTEHKIDTGARHAQFYK